MNTDRQRLPRATDVAEVVDQITTALLDAPARPTPATRSREREDTWTGCVTIDGPFQGAVLVECPRRFALRLSAAMLAADPRDIADGDARDALAEFTNIVGGNVKALISAAVGGTCVMSLPVVSDGALRISGEVARREVLVTCAGAVFSVLVLEARRPPAPAGAPDSRP